MGYVEKDESRGSLLDNDMLKEKKILESFERNEKNVNFLKMLYFLMFWQ